MKSNRIILLLIFFVIAYFLYHRNKKGPISDFGSSIKEVFSQPKEEENPYKSPEKPSEIELSKEDVFDKVAGIVKDKLISKNTSQTNDFSELAYFLPHSKSGIEVIQHKNYILGYAEKYENAVWTLHRLTKQNTYGNASRNGMEFKPDDKVSKQSALSSDYSRSGFDRGHLVPAGDFKCCQDLMEETFYMSNVCPQDREMNRYVWNDIENYVRSLSRKYKELYVFTGTTYTSNPKTIGKYNSISVPSQLYKIVLYYPENKIETAKAIAFLVENRNFGHKSIATFTVPIKHLEKMTGLDFFYKFPDNFEKKIELENNFDSW